MHSSSFKVICTECKQHVVPDLKAHFTKKIRCPTCPLCSLVMPNDCSLMAHLRLHSSRNHPYVCPDCGTAFSTSRYLVLHLLEKCFHVFKKTEYSCVKCPNSRFLYFEQYRSHMACHMVPLLVKCCADCQQVCPDSDLELHFKIHHPCSMVQYKTNLSCQLCPEMVRDATEFAAHCEEHYDSEATVFLCTCGQKRGTQASLAHHLRHCTEAGRLPSEWRFLHPEEDKCDLCLQPRGHVDPHSIHYLLQPMLCLMCFRKSSCERGTAIEQDKDKCARPSPPHDGCQTIVELRQPEAEDNEFETVDMRASKAEDADTSPAVGSPNSEVHTAHNSGSKRCAQVSLVQCYLCSNTYPVFDNDRLTAALVHGCARNAILVPGTDATFRQPP